MPLSIGRRAFLRLLGACVGASRIPAAGTARAQATGDAVGPTLELRVEELRRRVESLPAELARWKARAANELDKKLHFSQLQALDILIREFSDHQREIIVSLNPHGNADVFLKQSRDLIFEIIRAQEVWDFYRDKLQLRFSPDFKDSLRVADIVAWNCYRPVVERAAGAGILAKSRLREPPLCYYVAGFSPATSVRDGPIRDLRDRNEDLRDRRGAAVLTPIPVIQLPWEHAENIWEFLSIPHEVGHDLEADLKLRPALVESLDLALAGNPRGLAWRGWLGETFADLIALQLVGPAYSEMLMNLLLLPKREVTRRDPDDPHPPHYVRILLLTAYVRGLIKGPGPAEDAQRAVLSKHADQIEDVWKSLYGVAPGLSDYLADFPLVFDALMEKPLTILNNVSVRSLVPYESADDLRIRAASKYLETGENRPVDMHARHILAAARLAATRSGWQKEGRDSRLELINLRTTGLATESGPTDVLAPSGPGHRDFIAEFAKTISVGGGSR